MEIDTSGEFLLGHAYKKLIPVNESAVPNSKSIGFVSKDLNLTKRSNSGRAKNLRTSFQELSVNLRNSVRTSSSVYGNCCAKNCDLNSEFISLTYAKSRKLCKEHALRSFSKGNVVVDVFGDSVKGKKKTRNKVLFIYLEGWSYKKRSLVSSEFYPGTPKNPTVYFHHKLMDYCYKLAKGDMAANKIWENDCTSHIKSPPLKCYKQFLNILTEIISWSTLDENLIFSESKADRSDLDFMLSCPCCFGDKATNNILGVF